MTGPTPLAWAPLSFKDQVGATGLMEAKSFQPNGVDLGFGWVHQVRGTPGPPRRRTTDTARPLPPGQHGEWRTVTRTQHTGLPVEIAAPVGR